MRRLRRRRSVATHPSRMAAHPAPPYKGGTTGGSHFLSFQERRGEVMRYPRRRRSVATHPSRMAAHPVPPYQGGTQGGPAPSVNEPATGSPLPQERVVDEEESPCPLKRRSPTTQPAEPAASPSSPAPTSSSATSSSACSGERHERRGLALAAARDRRPAAASGAGTAVDSLLSLRQRLRLRRRCRISCRHLRPHL